VFHRRRNLVLLAAPLAVAAVGCGSSSSSSDPSDTASTAAPPISEQEPVTSA